MTNQLKPLSLALALVLGALAASSANAALVSTIAPVAFSGSASVTDYETGGATTITNSSLGSTQLNQFDASLGVLTGTAVNLVSTRTQTTQVKSTANGGSGINYEVTSTGTGSSSAQLTIPDGVTSVFGSVNQGDQCVGQVKAACIGTATSSTPTTTNENITFTALDSFVGVGTVTVLRSAPTLSAEQLSSVFDGTESTTTTLTWSGTLGATYTYLDHAIASFSSTKELGVLTLDFGSVLQNSTPSQLAFSVFNGSGVDRVGLDLDSIIGNGDLSQLYADLSGFNALGAGLHQDFWASMNTSNLGAFLTNYTLNLSDADVGAASSRNNNYSLTLNLKGSVVAANQLPANDVPEPGSLALLALGLVGLATSVRLRKV